MWLCSKYGFYSIVQKAPGQWQVRGRVKEDILRLRSMAKLDQNLVESAGTDYPYRLLLSEKDYLEVMAVLSASVDYANFKDMIHASSHQKAKYSAYSQFWGIMAKFGCKLWGSSGKSHVGASGGNLTDSKCKAPGCTNPLFQWERDSKEHPGYCEPCVKDGRAKAPDSGNKPWEKGRKKVNA